MEELTTPPATDNVAAAPASIDNPDPAVPPASSPFAFPPTFDFSLALVALKEGKKVARAGWNGKGMWIALSPGHDNVPAEALWSPANREYAASQPGRIATVLPAITMKTATGEILMGWLASQTDMLATDWSVV